MRSGCHSSLQGIHANRSNSLSKFPLSQAAVPAAFPIPLLHSLCTRNTVCSIFKVHATKGILLHPSLNAGYWIELAPFLLKYGDYVSGSELNNNAIECIKIVTRKLISQFSKKGYLLWA